MVIAPLSLRPDYWNSFQIEEKDLEFLYNHLLELETPLTTQEITSALVSERVRKEKDALEKHLPADGKLYVPKEHYQVNETVTFPALNWVKGKVVGIRPANNPEYPPFDVIEVEFNRGSKRLFAAGLETHHLNQPIEVNINDPLLNTDLVMRDYGDRLVKQLETALDENSDLVKIAGRWFPKALLVDINIGHLNLAEAILDMAGGGPFPTKALIEQIELPTDDNPKLIEFSLNLALQEDGRFDEIGPAGEVLWYLKRLEPEAIQTEPIYLRYTPVSYDQSLLSPEMIALEHELDDEISDIEANDAHSASETISLIYPHWRTGTLPLSNRVRHLFPTAYESPRVRFLMVDGESGTTFPAWVVRPFHYVFGLREWYETTGIMPGSNVIIQRGKKPNEMVVRIEKRRSAREWIRTVLVGADGGIVYAMLKQMVTATFDERMAIAISDVEALDRVWQQPSRQRSSFDHVAFNTMRELAKLTPQGHVHAQELYAAVNVIRRTSPGPLFYLLATNPAFTHVGDLYYRLENSTNLEKTE